MTCLVVHFPNRQSKSITQFLRKYYVYQYAADMPTYQFINLWQERIRYLENRAFNLLGTSRSWLEGGQIGWKLELQQRFSVSEKYSQVTNAFFPVTKALIAPRGGLR